MIGETGTVLLGLLLMEINIIKIKGAEKVCKSLPTYCSTYLPLFWKNTEVCISQVFNQSIGESVFISMIRDHININKHRHESVSANNSLYWNI